MKKNLIRLLPLVLLVAGCTREIVDPLAENRGLTVDFQLSTYYTQGTLLTKAPDELFDSSVTKTVFSGKDENGQDVTSSSQKERIDWKVGDKVDLMILKAGDPKDRRVYEIKAFTTEGNLKSKSTSVSSDNPFTFKGSGDYYIFATYPSHSIGKALKTGNGYDYGLWNPSSTTGGFGFHLPAGLTCSIAEKGGRYVVMDDMDYAVMTAGKKLNMSSPQSIEMEFKPFFNAYQLFLVNTEATKNYKLETVTVSCTDGFLRTKADVSNRLPSLINADGTMSWNNYTPETDRCIRSFTYNFKQLSGYSEGIPFNKPLDITLLALPIAQSGISITFTFSGGITRTLTLDPSVTLDPSHKLRIYNIGEEVEYELGNLQDILLAYNESGNRQVSATDKFVSRKRTKSAPSSWLPVSYLLEYYDEVNSTWKDINESPRGAQNPLNGLLSDITAGYTGSVTGEKLMLNLTQNTAQSTSSHDELQQFWRQKTDFDLSTINVATGRTIPSTTANCYVVDGYGTYKFPLVYGNLLMNGSFNGDGISSNFRNHNNAAFGNNAYIRNYAGNLIAQVLWTDVQGLVSNVRIDGDYLHFDVPKDKIRQGNALIGVLSGGTVVWSWHIWVTDIDLTVQQKASNEFKIATVNLGWCSDESVSNAAKRYLSRSFKIRARQQESGKVSEAIVVQRGKFEPQQESTSPGNNPYYQWGRKDPIQGNKTYYGSYAYAYSNSNTTLAEAIKNPHRFYAKNHIWCGTKYDNLWNVSGQKTVYDPSPVGYKVPPKAAFGTIRKTHLTFQKGNTWGKIAVPGGDVLRFPTTDARHHTSGIIGQQALQTGNYQTSLGSFVWTSESHVSLPPQALMFGFTASPINGNNNILIYSYPWDSDGYSPRSSGFSIRPVLDDIILVFDVDNTVDGQRIVIGDGGNWEN